MRPCGNPDQPENLWNPVPGDHGAHGSFDRRAHPRSLPTWGNLHRVPLVAAGLGALLLGTAAFQLSRR